MLPPQTCTNQKISVTVYYFADAIMGLGHVACAVSDGATSLYITPNTVNYNNLGDNSVDTELRGEMRAFNANNIIQITLPKAQITMSEFIENFNSTAATYRQTGHGLITNNCAHLASMVLHKVYNIPLRQGAFLRPSEVARDACALLDIKSSASITNRYTHFLHRLYIPSSQRIREISPITAQNAALNAITPILNMMQQHISSLTMLPSDQQLWKNKANQAITQFELNLKNNILSDKNLAESFKQLRTTLDEGENLLNDPTLNFFKKYLYELIRTFIKDPKLETLREFKSRVKELEYSVNEYIGPLTNT